MRVRPATIAAPLATATLALGTAAWAADGKLPFVPSDPVKALAVTARATGPIVANDLEGSAILHADALAPGETTSGEVTIRNAGDAPGAFTLSPTAATDAGAPPAGPLSGVLDLTVTDISGATPATVFDGKLGALSRLALGTFPAGASHRYRFELTYPAGIPAEIDNAYQGASTSVQFDWDAVAIGGTAGTTPTTPPTGSGPGAGSGGSTGAAGGAGGAAGGGAPATSPAAAGAIPATTATSSFRVTLVVARKRPVVKGRLVAAMASTGASRARVTGTVSWNGHRRMKLRPMTVKLAPKARKVRVRLPAAAVHGAKRRLTVRLTVTATSGARKATLRRTLRVSSR
jgi:hypothetical protein